MQFMPMVKSIVGCDGVRDSTLEEDLSAAKDLVAMRTTEGRSIAVRIRRSKWFDDTSTRKQFTIRSEAANGPVTELHKVLAGHGDELFYAWANRTETGFLGWMRIDLEQFRYYFGTISVEEYLRRRRDVRKNLRPAIFFLTTNRHGHCPGGPIWKERQNADGSAFVAFQADSFSLDGHEVLIDWHVGL